MLCLASLGPVLAGVMLRNRRLIVLSLVLTPVLVGLVASYDPRPRRGLALAVAAVVGFELFFGVIMYYVWLRLPWA
jgi:hypothetical protein